MLIWWETGYQSRHASKVRRRRCCSLCWRLLVHNPLFTVHKQYRNEWMRRFYWSIRSKWWCYWTLCTVRSTKTWQKKVHFRLASFAQKVVFGFPFMSWESLFYESNESISYESSYESALSAENTQWLGLSTDFSDWVSTNHSEPLFGYLRTSFS